MKGNRDSVPLHPQLTPPSVNLNLVNTNNVLFHVTLNLQLRKLKNLPHVKQLACEHHHLVPSHPLLDHHPKNTNNKRPKKYKILYPFLTECTLHNYEVKCNLIQLYIINNFSLCKWMVQLQNI